jgi:hypothetical protein
MMHALYTNCFCPFKIGISHKVLNVTLSDSPVNQVCQLQ